MTETVTVASGGKLAENRANQRDELRQRPPSTEKHSFPGQGKSSAPHPIPLFGGGSLPRIPPLKISGSKRGQRFAERTKAGRYRKHLRKRQVLVVRKHPENHIIQQ